VGAVSPGDRGTAGEPVHLVLEDEHRRLGARFGGFAGWWMPISYGSDRGEHLQTRAAAGLFDLSHMAEITLEGPDAVAVADATLTADVAALEPGRARYCFSCNDRGGVEDDLVVYRLGPDRLLVVANAANRDVVLGAITAAGAGRRAEVRDRTGSTVLLALQGPLAAEVTRGLTGGGELPARFGVTEAVIGGFDVLVSRTGYTGEDGFELFVDNAGAHALHRQILREGRGQVVPAGLAARDSLRLEAGLPLHGHELTRDLSPYDAGLGRFVALQKPAEFTGRAALARRAVTPGTRALVGLRGSAGRAPRAANPVLGPAGSPVGTVTSGAPSPSLGVPIAMAYVAPSLATPGTTLLVEVRGEVVTTEVVELPFYRRR